MSVLISIFAGSGRSADCGHIYASERPWSDPHMWTHAPFVLAAALFFHSEMFVECLLIMFILVLSLLYHRQFEKPCIGTVVEGFAAKSFAIIAALHFLQNIDCLPDHIKLIEIACFCALVFTFLATNLYRDLYDYWHAFIHIFAGIIACCCALYHKKDILLLQEATVPS